MLPSYLRPIQRQMEEAAAAAAAVEQPKPATSGKPCLPVLGELGGTNEADDRIDPDRTRTGEVVVVHAYRYWGTTA